MPGLLHLTSGELVRNFLRAADPALHDACQHGSGHFENTVNRIEIVSHINTPRRRIGRSV